MYVCFSLQAQQPGSPGGHGGAEDTPPIRIGPKGQVETEEEYQARLAHNSYMRFSRSLRRTLYAIYIRI